MNDISHDTAAPVPVKPTCQSKEIERRPSPSLPLLPPNTRETVALFGAARQKIDTPVRRGNIHSGKSSQIKMLDNLN